MRNVVYKLILILFFSLLIVSLVFPTSEAVTITKRFYDVKSQYENIVVFNFEILSSTGYDFLSIDEFVIDAEIDDYQLCILYLSDDVSLYSVNVILTSPSKKIFEHKIEKDKWFINDPSRTLVSYIPQSFFPSEFNESGIWYLAFEFEADKPLWPWEFNGFFFEFGENSDIRIFSYNMQNNHLKKAITVYAQGELIHVRSARATEKSVDAYTISIYL